MTMVKYVHQTNKVKIHPNELMMKYWLPQTAVDNLILFTYRAVVLHKQQLIVGVNKIRKTIIYIDLIWFELNIHDHTEVEKDEISADNPKQLHPGMIPYLRNQHSPCKSCYRISSYRIYNSLTYQQTVVVLN